MIVYAQTALCRWKPLLEALGETVEWEQCGRCDNCGHGRARQRRAVYDEQRGPRAAPATRQRRRTAAARSRARGCA